MTNPKREERRVTRYTEEILGGIKLALEGLTLDADGVVSLSSAERRLLMRLLTACQAYREATRVEGSATKPLQA